MPIEDKDSRCSTCGGSGTIPAGDFLGNAPRYATCPDCAPRPRGTVAELRALLDKATPGAWGTWRVEDEDGNPTWGVQGPTVMRPDEQGMMALNVAETKQGGGVDEHDAALIAALRNAAPMMLDVIEAASEVARCCIEAYEVARRPAEEDDEYTAMMRPLWNELRAALEAVK